MHNRGAGDQNRQQESKGLKFFSLSSHRPRKRDKLPRATRDLGSASGISRESSLSSNFFLSLATILVMDRTGPKNSFYSGMTECPPFARLKARKSFDLAQRFSQRMIRFRVLSHGQSRLSPRASSESEKTTSKGSGSVKKISAAERGGGEKNKNPH